ncbi:hypothetical protein KVR01_011950 [Diaporthe batatas]|uniref:uncharacterized protein n=1 Tax=Diaporthe batatas TaxID=748121 RepID=UPI001D050DA3|nr:uncharacterized protein KVR01_011950 [Diaporthe batatas]KAG8158189.1 hypothetical protein KVR01_011950 [Diaporthe batatas]
MSEASARVSGDEPYGGSGPSHALTSYLSALPTITEKISNSIPERNREERLEEDLARLDVKINGKGSGKG